MQTMLIGTKWVNLNQLDFYIHELNPKGTLFELKDINTDKTIEIDLIDKLFITHDKLYAIRTLYGEAEIVLAAVQDIKNTELTEKIESSNTFPDFRVSFYLASN